MSSISCISNIVITCFLSTLLHTFLFYGLLLKLGKHGCVISSVLCMAFDVVVLMHSSTELVVVVVVLLFYVNGKSKVMLGRSVNLTTHFLGRLRPPMRLTSTSCTYFRQ